MTNKGELRWMVLDGAVTAPALIRFCQRLIRESQVGHHGIAADLARVEGKAAARVSKIPPRDGAGA